jgi:hypothetical protein
MSGENDPSDVRRRGLLSAVAILMMTCLATFDAFLSPAGQLDGLDGVRIAMVMLLALVLILRSTTGFTIRREPPEMGDELVRSNRASAALWGLGAMVLSTMSATVAGLFTTLSLVSVAPLILVAGAVAAAGCFALLEARGQTGE